jgi:archaellum component FlaC
MNNLEKASAVIGAIVFVFTLGVGWNSLNNRIDKVDEKMTRIEKSVGSTACNSILSRQIEAIEKGSAKAREALEQLSAQYNCVRLADSEVYADALAVDAENAALSVELNSVDAILNEGR